MLADTRAAARRIAPHIERTPLVEATALGERLGCKLWLKAENLQVAGAFKARGAHNAVFLLPDNLASRGVATHSSGNHGAALALAAKRRAIRAYIVVPRGANPTKVAAIESHGAVLIECEPTLDARESRLAEVVKSTGAQFIHPYENADVMAGQGTVALEIIDRFGGNGPDVVVAPLGGGGLLGGVSSVLHEAQPSVVVYGVEPTGAADGQRGFRTGVRVQNHVPDTVADGLLTTVGVPNFEVIRRCVTDIVVAPDAVTMSLVADIEKATGGRVEPSGAVSVAGIASNRDLFEGRSVVAVISGGNPSP